MSSKEALLKLCFKYLPTIDEMYLNLDEEDEELLKVIQKDLEMLELIKKELGNMFLDTINYIIEDDNLGEVEIHPNLLKLKEWLEDD